MRLLKDDDHYLHDVAADQRRGFLERLDYLSYLRDYAGMDDAVLKIMQSVPRSVWAINADAYPARDAWNSGYPGFGDLDLGVESYDREGDQQEPNIFHFPDGNATVARLLVRKLLPAVAPGKRHGRHCDGPLRLRSAG